MRLPVDQWVELLTDGKNEFGADGAAAVFSTWRVEEEGDVDGAGQLDLDARMTDGEGGEAACNPPRGRVPSSDQVLAGM